MGNVLQILQGLAKSYFNVKGGSSPAIQVGYLSARNVYVRSVRELFLKVIRMCILDLNVHVQCIGRKRTRTRQFWGRSFQKISSNGVYCRAGAGNYILMEYTVGLEQGTIY